MAGRGKTKKQSERRASKYTDEQIAQFRAADQALQDRATEAMDDQATMERLERVLRSASEKVLGYSLNNQMLIFTQAAKLGLPVTDVATWNGWAKRGRRIKDEYAGKGQGIRINAPSRRDDKPEPGKPLAIEARPEDRAPKDENEKPRFRMITVYLTAMTEPIPDVESTPAEPLEPVDVDAENALLEQQIAEAEAEAKRLAEAQGAAS